MPELEFKITDVETASCGLVPLLRFNLNITNQPETETIHTIMLHTEIQIRSKERAYRDGEREKLAELFGDSEKWERNLRNRLWGHSETTIRGFRGSTEAILPMPCTFDLNVASTKYFHALDGGEVPLQFLFTGTVFYETEGGGVKTQEIPWQTDCDYSMPVAIWQKMMDHHFPNTAWLYLQRDVFERLYTFKRATGCNSWEDTISCLLAARPAPAASAVALA